MQPKMEFNQQNRSVAFFSKMLNESEVHHSSVKKEAFVIVEAVQKWAHFLFGCQFTIITD